MYSSQEVKSVLENIHKKAILEITDLEDGKNYLFLRSGNTHVDFVGKRNIEPFDIFEMKTKAVPRKAKRAPSQYRWAELSEKQRTNYQNIIVEQGLKGKPYWMFVLGDTPIQVTEIPELNEKSILSRRIYVVPWNAYSFTLPPTSKGYRNFNTGKLLNLYKFEKRTAGKNTLFVERGIIKDIGFYFRF